MFGGDLLRLRYRIHCNAALSFDQAAQNDIIRVRSLGDLATMQDDVTCVNARQFCTDFDYFRIYIKTGSAELIYF